MPAGYVALSPGCAQLSTSLPPLALADHSRAGAAGQEGQVLPAACCAHPGPARSPLPAGQPGGLGRQALGSNLRVWGSNRYARR